jgi:hypothetical protein
MGSDSGVKEGKKGFGVWTSWNGMYIYVRLPDGIPQARLLCITMERKDQVTALSSSEDK